MQDEEGIDLKPVRKKDYKVLESCLCCGATFLYPYLYLGEQPPCNSFRHPSAIPQQEFPLELMRCAICKHSQLSIAVSPKVLFSHYPYRTGISNTLINHYESLAKEVIFTILPKSQPNRLHSSLRVLDIGCNDGTLLNGFKKATSMNVQTWGIDPCTIQDSHGIDFFMEGLWSEQLISHYQIYPKSFDIITATNVLAHNDNPKFFLRLASEVLRDEGVMVVEFPYARDVLTRCEFDTIYHEHISYFLINPFLKLLEGTGLYVSEFRIIEIHGGSLRLVLRTCNLHKEESLHCVGIKAEAAREYDDFRLSTTDFFDDFQGRVDTLKKDLILEINKCRKENNGVLVGFGASGKSSVILNYCELKPMCILDETPSKIGLISPGMDIPIYHPDFVSKQYIPMIFLIMSWNCMEETLQKIHKHRLLTSQQDIGVTYVPRVESFRIF